MKITYNSLSTKLLNTLAFRTIKATKQDGHPEAVNHPLFKEVEEKAAVYEQVVVKDTYSGMGPAVKNADLLRDRNYSRLKRILEGYAIFGDTPKGNVSVVLLKEFKRAGSIKGKTYAVETTILQNLISALNNDVNKTHIQTLGIETEMAELEQSQTAFEQLYLHQTDTNSALRQEQSASSIRKQLHEALRNYFALVTAMRHVEIWTDLYADLNEVLKTIKQDIRKTSPENASEDDSRK